VGGIRTNIGFFRHILDDPAFRAGALHTQFIDEFLAREGLSDAAARSDIPVEVAALAAAIHTLARANGAANGAAAKPVASAWRLSGREDLLR
jgi:acetyl/propionyl-CoA carboxylase alpha subunit